MTESDEDPLTMAERRVADAETRVARQVEIIAEMDRDDHPHAAAVGRDVLVTLRESLELARARLDALRGGTGKPASER